MPSYLLQLPESVTDVLVADTGASKLYRFRVSRNSVVYQDERYMSIGLNGAGKQRAWDRKTPLGVYFVTERLDTSKLAARYGDAAFALDYPNAWDRLNARTGSGIWLHGVDRQNPERPPRDTDGCLALPNPALLALAEDIEPLRTPVIVARDIDWVHYNDLALRRLEFRIVLDMWRKSLERGDLPGYLALYADDFHRHGMDKAAWSEYLLKVFEARRLIEVRLDDLMLLADPEEAGLYISRFTQVLATSEGAVESSKRLYWRREKSDTWRIVSEDSG